MENQQTQATAQPAKPKPKKRHFSLLVVLFSLLLMFGGSLLFVVPLAIITILFPQMDPAVTNVLTSYTPFLGVVIVTLLFCLLFERDIFKSMLWPKVGGSRGNTLKMFLLGLLAGFLSNGLCVLAAWLKGDVSFAPGRLSVPFLLFAFVNVMIQSSAEELFSRGYMQGALQERYGIITAVLVNGLFFGLLHLPNPGITVLSFMNISLYGIIMSLVAYYFKSLWFCMAYHTAWNFTQNYIFGLPNSGLPAQGAALQAVDAKSSIIYDATFGVEGGIVFCVLGVIAAVAMILWFRKKPATPKAQTNHSSL